MWRSSNTVASICGETEIVVVVLVLISTDKVHVVSVDASTDTRRASGRTSGAIAASTRTTRRCGTTGL